VMIATLLSVLASGALLVILGLHDPKRLRNARQTGAQSSGGSESDGTNNRAPLSTALRRTLGWLTLAPGVVLGVLGAWWALVVWAGAFGAIGWTIAQVLPGKAARNVS
jgi:hypothetical protein